MASAQPTSFDCFTGQHLVMSYQWSAAMPLFKNPIHSGTQSELMKMLTHS